MNTKKVSPIARADNTEKALKVALNQTIFHRATPAHGNKMRGVGITRKNKEQTKKARKLAKSMRRMNLKRN